MRLQWNRIDFSRPAGASAPGLPQKGSLMMKRRIDKREIFSIPNLMGYFRILLIPLFSWLYCTADSTGDYYAAAAVVGVSGLTDMFDGKIARRFNMITELGKFIDPLADKLTQAALLICLAVR